MGTAALKDAQGRDLNLDGTPKITYKHPNHSSNNNQQRVDAQVQQQQHNLDGEEEQYDGRRNRNMIVQPLEMQSIQPVVKPARFNISEYDCEDADSWIQQVEQYFEASRTPPEQMTEFAVS
jgi:hypothetical protein